MPRPGALAAATLVAVGGSLAVNWLLVTWWTTTEPAARGYGHFRFADYATLTVVGVLAAGAAWPAVCRISPRPRRPFLRLAVVVTVVLWVPDAYLLARHQPARDVAVLMVLHVAVAVVTYQALVGLAPPRRLDRPVGGGVRHEAGEERLYRWSLWLALLVGVEFALGLATLVLVPTGRPTGWWPEQGTAVYLAHAVVGLPLAVLAANLLVRARRSTRLLRLSGWIGGVGVVLAGLGGILTVAHPLRLVGVALMLVGPVVAAFGYLIPVFDRLSEGSATDDRPGVDRAPGTASDPTSGE